MRIGWDPAFSGYVGSTSSYRANSLPFINHDRRKHVCQPRNQSNSGQDSPMFNLASAAAATGVDRCTILCAINGGRLNAQRDAKGSWEI
jgi:hypothetical protein